MNYIGSKLSLLDFLNDTISQVIDPTCKIFCDLFAGTGIVGSYFKQKGFSIIANDIQYYSYVLNRHLIGTHQPLHFQGLIPIMSELQFILTPFRTNYICEYLSMLPMVKGFIYKNYCLEGNQNHTFSRQYFSDENGQLCDAIRQRIEEWYIQNFISEDEYFFLLASLLESIDQVANTASVYGAYLKTLKKSAKQKLKLKPLPIIETSISHQIYQEDINTLIKKIKGDILYLDPPYNHRQYAQNYHLLETIAKYDNPIIKGKTGLRSANTQNSKYCSKIKAKEAFKDLILNANMKYIFLSYNNEGILSLEDIREILSLKGDYHFTTKSYQRFKADKTENRTFQATKTVEYLHYVKCF